MTASWYQGEQSHLTFSDVSHLELESATSRQEKKIIYHDTYSLYIEIKYKNNKQDEQQREKLFATFIVNPMFASISTKFVPVSPVINFKWQKYSLLHLFITFQM